MTYEASERPFRHLFLIDPLETLLPDKDTTFVLMLEALRRGHLVYSAEIGDLFIEKSAPKVRCDRTDVFRGTPAFQRHGELTVLLSWFDAIYMRKDPPVDQAYLHATQILSMVPRTGPLVLNEPRALRDANEKLYALEFPNLIPRTLVSSKLDLLRSFLEDLGGQMIIKPLDGAGGRGIFFVQRDDRNLNSLLETATDDGKTFIIAQQYIPEVRKGDKRILLLDGEPLGAVLRVPREDDTRSNIHAGGRCESAAVTPNDRRIIAELRPRLRAEGLYFVGIDVIGNYLTEVNVTSPTGVQEIDNLTGSDLSRTILDFVCRRVTSRRDAQEVLN